MPPYLGAWKLRGSKEQRMEAQKADSGSIGDLISLLRIRLSSNPWAKKTYVLG